MKFRFAGTRRTFNNNCWTVGVRWFRGVGGSGEFGEGKLSRQSALYVRSVTIWARVMLFLFPLAALVRWAGPSVKKDGPQESRVQDHEPRTTEGYCYVDFIGPSSETAARNISRRIVDANSAN